MLTQHDFQDSLAKSHAAEDLPFWEECYRKFFPDLVSITNHRKDSLWQRSGVDRSLVLATSKQYLVDEKVRFKDYGDILLEEYSDQQRRVPGWAEKPCK